MNCDQVFMVLTRGPFPSGDPSDPLVEDHLATCAECWQFAEALRPALDVFQESIPPAEGRDLPGYWGDTDPAAVMVADLVQAGTRTLPREQRLPHQEAKLPPELAASPWVDALKVIGFLTIVTATAIGLSFLWK